METTTAGIHLEPSQEFTATMDVSTVRFSKILDGMATVAGKDETRGYICGVFVRCDEKGIVLSATNGHVAMAKRFAHWAEGDDERVQGFDFMIPTRSIRLVSQDLRSLKGPGDWTTRIAFDRYGSDKASASFGSAEHPGIVTIETVDADFPELRKVAPAGSSRLASGRVKFNVALVAPYFQTVYGSREDHKIEMRFQESTGGIEIRDENDFDFYGILMPLWSDDANEPRELEPPAWLV